MIYQVSRSCPSTIHFAFVRCVGSLEYHLHNYKLLILLAVPAAFGAGRFLAIIVVVC